MLYMTDNITDWIFIIANILARNVKTQYLFLCKKHLWQQDGKNCIPLYFKTRKFLKCWAIRCISIVHLLVIAKLQRDNRLGIGVCWWWYWGSYAKWESVFSQLDSKYYSTEYQKGFEILCYKIFCYCVIYTVRMYSTARDNHFGAEVCGLWY